MALSRSEQMSRIRGVDTTPEVALRNALAVRGFVHDADAKAPAGKPDVILSDARLAVFVDGCFWHGCPLHYARPRSRAEFWAAKLVTNLERDAFVSAAITASGWRVIRLWEHEVVEGVDDVADAVASAVRAGAAGAWVNERRVRSVVEVAERVERREVVLLGQPAEVIEVTQGARVTAKARRSRR